MGQATDMGDKVTSSLLCPNQLRFQGVIVDDVPVHLAPPNKPSILSIYCPDDDFTIPLSLKASSHILIHAPQHVKKLTHVNGFILQMSMIGINILTPSRNKKTMQPTYITIINHKIGIFTLFLHHTDMGLISKSLDDRHIMSLQSASTIMSSHDFAITAEKVDSNWNIVIDSAKKTLKVITQKGIRQPMYPIEQHFRTKQAQLCYRQLGGHHGRFYMDTFFSSVPSLNGCTMAQLFSNDLSFTKIYPMKTKSKAPHALSTFIHDVGIPSAIHSDNAPELMKGKFRELCKEYSIPCTFTEPYSPWQNRAEGGIKELKRNVLRKMKSKAVPQRL
jgi:hypothetical protein